MNWIEAALARQEELLCLLLSGGTAAEKKRAEELSVPFLRQSARESRGETKMAEEPKISAAEIRRDARTVPALSVEEETARTGTDPGAAGFRAGTVSSESERGTALPGLPRAQGGSWEAPGETRADNRQGNGADFAAAAGPEAAESLSRAVERDARRYDGAISLC